LRVPAWLFLLGAGCAQDGKQLPAAPHAAVEPATKATVRYGTNRWVECTPGDLPLVLSVPHGGSLRPAGIPDRTRGETAADLRTLELARAIVAAFEQRTGRAPYLVVSNLHRKKLDPNRAISEAAAGDDEAELAWREYHDFVDEACADVAKRFGTGLYLDLHGHAHREARIELGYLLSARDLDRSDADLAKDGVAARSSLRALALTGENDFARALRGPESFGGLLSREYACVPSPALPSPGIEAYFSGGFSTKRHTNTLPGLQIETPFAGVRDTEANRARFASALAKATDSFLLIHCGIRL
jgi:hypothetical protein